MSKLSGLALLGLFLMPSAFAQGWIHFEDESSASVGVETSEDSPSLILEVVGRGFGASGPGTHIRYFRAKTRLGFSKGEDGREVLSYLDLQFEPLAWVTEGEAQGDRYRWSVGALPVSVSRDFQLGVDSVVSIRAVGFELAAETADESFPAGFLPNFAEVAVQLLGYRAGVAMDGTRFVGGDLGSVSGSLGYGFDLDEGLALRLTVVGYEGDLLSFMSVQDRQGAWLFRMSEIFSKLQLTFSHLGMNGSLFLQGGFRTADHPVLMSSPRYSYLRLGVSLGL